MRLLCSFVFVLAILVALPSSPPRAPRVLPDLLLPALDKAAPAATVSPDQVGAIVGFYSSWCAFCDDFLSEFAQLVEEVGESPRVFLVGVADGRRQLKAKLEAQPEAMPAGVKHLVDFNEVLFGELGLGGLPALVVLDRFGVVAYQCLGCQGAFAEALRVARSLEAVTLPGP